MESGYSKAQSDNLPIVNTLMMCTFFSNNTDYLSSEIRGVKASRSCRENYGDNAIGYAQVKRTGALCTVKARITPEHKVRTKAYQVTLICNEEEGIVESCVCEDCPASQGGCKHALAFLSWVHRRSEEPSKTSIQCYWKRSKMAEIGSSNKLIKCEELGKKTSKIYANDGSILPTLIRKTEEAGVKDIIFMRYFSDASPEENLSIHKLMENFRNKKIGTTADEFIGFCKNTMNSTVCREAANLTLEQSSSSLWHELRYGRITASKFYEAAHCTTMDGSLVEYLLGAKICDTEALKRGRNLEGDILKQLKKSYPNIKNCGLLLSANHPLFGASPDGICADFIIEIKCPSTEKWIDKYFNGDRPSAKFFAQMQLQMHFSNKNKGLFCVASPDYEKSGEIKKCFIDYDKNYCVNLMEKAREFWKNALFIKLFQ